MKLEQSFTPTEATAAKGYRAKTAQDYFRRYPKAQRVLFFRRDGGKLGELEPLTIAHIFATKGGKWGKSSETRVHPSVTAQ